MKEEFVNVECIKIRLSDKWIFLSPKEASDIKRALDDVIGRESLQPVASDGSKIYINPNAEPMPHNWIIRLGMLNQSAILEITT